MLAGLPENWNTQFEKLELEMNPLDMKLLDDGGRLGIDTILWRKGASASSARGAVACVTVQVGRLTVGLFEICVGFTMADSVELISSF